MRLIPSLLLLVVATVCGVVVFVRSAPDVDEPDDGPRGAPADDETGASDASVETHMISAPGTGRPSRPTTSTT